MPGLGHAIPRRYTATAQALHWLTAALVFAALPLAWVALNIARDAPDREWMFTLHKSVGLTLVPVIAFRLAWRVRHPAPPLPVDLPRWQALAARVSHWLLYFIVIGMVVSGYLLSATGDHPLPYFDLFRLPLLPKNDTVEHIGIWLHVAIGQWLVYLLILLHLAATVWHVAVRRDGALDRMLPPQR